MCYASALITKIDEISNLARISHIDVVGVIETWLHDELKDSKVIFFSAKIVFPAKEEEEELLSTCNSTSDRGV